MKLQKLHTIQQMLAVGFGIVSTSALAIDNQPWMNTHIAISAGNSVEQTELGLALNYRNPGNGDIDGNKVIDSRDVTFVQNYANNPVPPTSPSQSDYAAADMNGNGIVNNFDYLILSTVVKFKAGNVDLSGFTGTQSLANPNSGDGSLALAIAQTSVRDMPNLAEAWVKYQIADFNKNGIVTVNDGILIGRIAVATGMPAYGDINFDGRINASDSNAISNLVANNTIVGLSTSQSDLIKALNADLNGDGLVTSLDRTILLNMRVGNMFYCKICSPPVPVLSINASAN